MPEDPIPDAAGSHRSDFQPGSVQSALLHALAAYVRNTRDREDIRRAIRAWQGDARKLEVEPETVLVQFRRVITHLETNVLSAAYDHRLAARRDLILSCIDEWI
jgi:hypothetical protein